MKETILKNPYNLHVHLREGRMLAQVAPFTTKIFSAAVAMPNLKNPVTTREDVEKYRREIMLYCHSDFQPVMGVMASLSLSPEELEEAYEIGVRFLKNIPIGISTNAIGASMNMLEFSFPSMLFKKAKELNMVCSFHCEYSPSGDLNDPDTVDDSIHFLADFVEKNPGLKIVIEHANTRKLIEFVINTPDNVKATISSHYAYLTRDDVINENRIMNPLNLCRPLPRYEDDRLAIIGAMTGYNQKIRNKFAFGSDSAPHYYSSKLSTNPATGIFTEPVVLPLLAQIFENAGRLQSLQDFVSPPWAPEFYGFTPKPKTIVLRKEPWKVPLEYEGIPIFKGGEVLDWQIAYVIK